VLKMSVTICPNCGTQNPTGSKFCLKCGAYFNESEDIDKTKKLERKEKKKKREPILTHDMIPFIGDSVIESENFTTGGDATVGCGAASSDRFNIYFQQRNKLILNILFKKRAN
jgi:threonine synthase